MQKKIQIEPEWIEEKAAAAMVGYQPRTLRKYAKSGKIEVNFTSLFGRKFFYNKHDLSKVLLQASTIN